MTFNHLPLIIPIFATAYLLGVYVFLAALSHWTGAWRKPES